MLIKDNRIDSGKPFDWGRVSDDYAKYRDIYPDEFYKRITDLGLCTAGQTVLDVGTGTGVLPRNMYKYGARWIGTDISNEQIEKAKLLSENLNIEYRHAAAESLDFRDNYFNVITACQCFGYFDHKKTAPVFFNLLKPNGCVLLLYMAWLPHEDRIAAASEKLILKYSPEWSGANEFMHPISVPDCYNKYFELTHHEEYRVKVHFTRDGWNGRVKACRGIGASLDKDEISAWEKEHLKLLRETAPNEFDVLHYAALTVLKAKK